MYLIPLTLIVLVAIGILAGPLFALVALVLFLVAFGLYKFLGPGTEPEHASPGETPAAGDAVTSKREATESGMWGEKWPEQQEGQEPSGSEGVS